MKRTELTARWIFVRINRYFFAFNGIYITDQKGEVVMVSIHKARSAIVIEFFSHKVNNWKVIVF